MQYREKAARSLDASSGHVTHVRAKLHVQRHVPLLASILGLDDVALGMSTVHTVLQNSSVVVSQSFAPSADVRAVRAILHRGAAHVQGCTTYSYEPNGTPLAVLWATPAGGRCTDREFGFF